MNRKLDKHLRDIHTVSCDWTEKRRFLTPHPSGNPRITVSFDSSERMCKAVLNPDEINMKQFIETGIPVDPSSFSSAYQFQDPADLEQFLESHAGKVLDYAKRNKDAILSAIKGIPSSSPVSVEPVEPAKNE